MLSARYKYIPKRNSSVILSHYSKKKIEQFNKEIKNLFPLDCMICSSRVFERISESDRFGLFYPTGICTKCGNVQQEMYYSEEDIIKFYDKFYHEMYYGIIDPPMLFCKQVKIGEKICSFIGQEYYSKVKDVLEIGTGTGGILKAFKNRGKSVLGLDFNDVYMSYGISQGINITRGEIEDLDKDQKFDLIICSHILEHTRNPQKFLLSLKKHLSPNGIVYIEVPSLESIYEGIYGHDLKTYFSNAHTIHFCKKSFKNILKISGYKAIKLNSVISCLSTPCQDIVDIDLHFDASYKLLVDTEKRYLKRSKTFGPYVIGKAKTVINHILIFLRIKRYIKKILFFANRS